MRSRPIPKGKSAISLPLPLPHPQTLRPRLNRSANVCPQCVTTVTGWLHTCQRTERLRWASLTLWDPYLKASQQCPLPFSPPLNLPIPVSTVLPMFVHSVLRQLQGVTCLLADRKVTLSRPSSVRPIPKRSQQYHFHPPPYLSSPVSTVLPTSVHSVLQQVQGVTYKPADRKVTLSFRL